VTSGPRFGAPDRPLAVFFLNINSPITQIECSTFYKAILPSNPPSGGVLLTIARWRCGRGRGGPCLTRRGGRCQHSALRCCRSAGAGRPPSGSCSRRPPPAVRPPTQMPSVACICILGASDPATAEAALDDDPSPSPSAAPPSLTSDLCLVQVHK
jgi:hypothetical protein